MTDANDASWQILYKSAEESNVALILGAGLSFHEVVGLPTWDSLVLSLAERAQFGKEASILIRVNVPMPVITSLVRNEFYRKVTDKNDYEKRLAWAEEVRDTLYNRLIGAMRIDSGSKDWAMPGRLFYESHESTKVENKGLASFLDDHFPNLTAVVRLCARQLEFESDRKSEREWGPRPGIAAVLTYNVDALIQIYDRARHKRRVTRTIERACKDAKSHKIPVYHLHGYLQPEKVDIKHEAPDALVLCEDDYHARTDEPYSFAMTSMLWALRELTCVFVGCSMRDELMRRVLHRSRTERHAAAIAQGSKGSAATDATMRHFAIMARADCAEARDADARCKATKQDLDNATEQNLELLGVRPLWVDNKFTDVPRRLDELGRRLDARTPP